MQVRLAQYSWPTMLSVEVQATALHVWMLHGKHLSCICVPAMLNGHIVSIEFEQQLH